VDDALRDKILASLDPAPDQRPDKALARALERDPAARAYAAGLRRVDRALRSWPLRERPESAWAAGEARVLAALDADAKVRGGARVPPGEIDDLAPPSFDDDGASTMETPPAMSEPNEHDPDLDNLAALTRTSLAPGALPSVRPHAPSLADASDDTSSGIVDIKQLSAIARDAAATLPPKAPEPAALPKVEEPKKSDAKPAAKKDDVMVTAKPAVPALSTEAPRRTGGGPMWAIGGMAVMAGAFLIYNSSRDSAPTSPSAMEATAPESVPQAVPVAASPTPAEPASAAPAAEAAPVAAPPPPPSAEPVAAPAPVVAPAPEAQARRHAAEPAAAPHRERVVAAATPAPTRPAAAAAAAPAPAAAPTPPPAARPAPAPAAPAGGGPSSVDDLLRRAAPSAAAPVAAATAAPSADLPERLGRAQITGVLSPLTGAVRSCAQGQTGTAPVSIVIGNDGAVRTATVGGQFGGTPIGDCIAGVVRRAHFPQFRAATQNLMFPYVITPPR